MSTDRTTEILHHLSATSRDMGELRTETRTQIGELRTQVSELHTGMNKVNAEVVEARLDLLPIRTELLNLHSELREVQTDVRAIVNRLDRLEAKLLNTQTGTNELTSTRA